MAPIQYQESVELYVSSSQGDDTASGDSLSPLKTLTQALQRATPNTVINLGRGSYTLETGEQFPLVIPDQVSIIGNVAAKGSGVKIAGSGSYTTAFGSQFVTVVIQGKGQLRGVTVSHLATPDPLVSHQAPNQATKGTGIWLEAGEPTVANCTLSQCSREGLLVTGTANPVINNCLFQDNAASGLTFVRDARGEFRNNVCRKNGFGLVISDRAAPLIAGNQIAENRSGIVISGSATPVLRSNIVTLNAEDGLALFGQALPDLGQQTDPAGNRLRDNQRFDLHNTTKLCLISSGNQLNPLKTQGPVEFLATRSPSAPIPPLASPEPLPPVPVAPSHAPADLKTHWAVLLVQPLLDRQIISPSSDGHFHPQAPLTSSEFASWVQKAGLKLPTGSMEEPALNPNVELTRWQILKQLIQSADLSLAPPSYLTGYPQRTQIPNAQAVTLATAMYHRLVVLPVAERLDLQQPVTRAEAAAMLHQTLVATGQGAAVNLPQILRLAAASPPPRPPARPPIVVIDPGHGGSDPGMTTQVKPAEVEMQELPFSPAGTATSPLPAGVMLPDLPPGLPSGLPPGLPPELLAEMGMPPGMPPRATGEPRPGMPDDLPEMPSLQEKEVVLSIARAVADFLQQQGVRAILTRSDDQALTLAERVAIAQREQADIMVSIHANASLSNQPSINGIETYYSPTSAEGGQLAWAIHKALTRMPDILDRGVHPATFPTLSGAKASAHVEVGYLTGDQDAPSLGNLAFHRYLARPIANGILRYVRQG